jgi:2'-5' RNA ligase
MQFDTTTALTLIVPEHVWDRINGIRKDHDSAYSRWMPHVNFLFPFVSVELFDEYHEKLQNALKGFGQIELHFDKIGHFGQKGGVTVNLQLNNDSALQKLFGIINSIIPEIKPKHNEFHPHLTLGQFKKAELDGKLKELNEWLGDGITVTIDNIYMINRSKTDGNVPFSINRTISLK